MRKINTEKGDTALDSKGTETIRLQMDEIKSKRQEWESQNQEFGTENRGEKETGKYTAAEIKTLTLLDK